jgi:large subunit ribosomal protein L21
MATKTKTQSYAIIAVGGKQYVVREGEQLLVDRVGTDEGKTFQPGVLFVGGDGEGTLAPRTQVTARVVGHVLGDKVRIGKYRPKNGYKRHTGFRARLTQIQIESIGSSSTKRASTTAPKADASAPAKAEAPAAAKPAAAEEKAAQPPRGYADFTVADINEKSKRWKLEQLEAALAYEQEHAQRKGAIAALESAIEGKKEG